MILASSKAHEEEQWFGFEVPSPHRGDLLPRRLEPRDEREDARASESVAGKAKQKGTNERARGTEMAARPSVGHRSGVKLNNVGFSPSNVHTTAAAAKNGRTEGGRERERDSRRTYIVATCVINTTRPAAAAAAATSISWIGAARQLDRIDGRHGESGIKLSARGQIAER